MGNDIVILQNGKNAFLKNIMMVCKKYVSNFGWIYKDIIQRHGKNAKYTVKA
jgi:hypothetical protein